MAKRDSKFILLPLLLISAGAFGAAKSDERVWISRPDGSLQCEVGAEKKDKDPVVTAKDQLTKKGIHVLEAKKRSDGKMHAQMCGISTGNETSFLIPKNELTRAKSLGFEAIR
jgi:hypothetical protein